MNEKERRFVDQLRGLSIEEFDEFDGQIAYNIVQDLLKMLDKLEIQQALRPPIGTSQVIRVQGSHDSLIPPESHGPLMGGC